MKPAFGRRVLAHLADAALVFLLWAAVAGPYLEGLDARLAEVEAVCGQAAADEVAALALLRALALWCVIWFAYFVGFTALSGRTPGKEAASLAVAAAEGGRAPLAAVVFRESLARAVSFTFLALGYLWALWERQGRAWHDLLSGTRVVATPAPALVPSGPPAGFWRRAAAVVLDGVMVAVVAGLLRFLAPAAHAWQAAVTLASVAYYVLFVGLAGSTPGKLALGLRVEGPGGRPPGVGRALVRETAGRALSGLGLCLGYLWMLWQPERRCWHDLVAGTCVVRGARGPR